MKKHKDQRQGSQKSETMHDQCIDMLSAGAAPGPDGIPAAMIKGAKNVFSNLLSSIMRSTMDSGNIPSILKTAYVTPIHKGESRSDLANF